jgi:hypothetical protein
MLRRTLLPIALVATLLAPAAASAKQVVARHRSLTATLSYRGRPGSYRDLELTITRGARTLYRGPVTAPQCGHECWPQTDATQSPVRFAALDGAGSADVVLNLYTGGAHCCSVAEVLRPSAAMNGDYVISAEHDFGDPGDRLETIAGHPVFVTADDTFAYAFTDFADSGLPLALLRLEGVKFADVTGGYPTLVRRDAARWLADYRRASGKNDVGLIAAWAADEATLDRWPSAHAYLVSQARAGRLTSALYPKSAAGTRFITKLEALLNRDGYLR